MKAYSIYKLAITLLSSLPTPTNSPSLLFHIAILNNCGVWCLENRECTFMAQCFEELTHLLDETYCGDNDSTLIKSGIFHNLKAALNDPHLLINV